ncbi:E3 ubiquitin protein ligase RIN2 [Lactuca sativa]|uniref:E3 ubiquitin protein ligase RIN2 n=1 Tax=Lactuca sativa TaxID=4236 RepID=UPI000CD88008|nr:E3 ubiquitin protein ligase RIN2 [Lactuca sativa]XP_023753274.1 E3 ubiquitin protein ligase RIN2 [Lactuca sativa]XP_042754276.1 E3 ubiquitin protein ligase RIN2 [Lactuca sativa]XP_042754277.1 E3 ubiquitin protein ligase RIN2 [Lactuca sativa]XP_042754278.1 E3 ubiquitin protein ligase RIN2 [Lactuca sativa]XP_052623522.1 E3 ubiquitin protein ligase RIN2 [Lactuca sativa]
MGVSYLPVSAIFTVLSITTLHYWTEPSLTELKSDGLNRNILLHPEDVTHALELLLLSSNSTIALVANFVINIYLLIILSLKTIFFGELHAFESRKLLEQLVNYVMYKGMFLPLVVPPTVIQVGSWSTWLIVVSSLKMFQALARDRLQSLNSSPSATPRSYFRVYCVLLLVISVDVVWIRICMLIYDTTPSSLDMLLFFEPLSIASETLQAILAHGFQLLDIWKYHSTGTSTNSKMSKLIDISSAGAMWEWKSVLSRNLGFLLEMMSLLMALAHYVHILWLHGVNVHILDAVIFLNIRALLSAIVKRTKGFIKLQLALATLNGALPDATSEEIKSYDDECAICREPMTKAKKLTCNHLFHLSCLRSWLDQGQREYYSCPTCRKPLFGNVTPNTEDISNDEQIARELSSALEWQNPHGHTHTTLPSWNFWPINAFHATSSSSSSSSNAPVHNHAPTVVPDDSLNRVGLHLTYQDLRRMVEMAEIVREVLPHVPRNIIMQDLERTMSTSVTVNNLLQI